MLALLELRFWPFRAVFRTALFAVLHALRVERTADDVVADAGQIFDAAAADEHDRVLLKIVADAWDVRGHFDAVCETNACHFAQRRVRLFRRDRLYLRADSAPKGVALFDVLGALRQIGVTWLRTRQGDVKRRRLRLFLELLAALAHELTYGRQIVDLVGHTRRTK